MTRNTDNLSTPAGDNRWQDYAACRGEPIDVFYPDRSDGMSGYRDARQICRQCPVRAECLTEALKQGERYGCWGGMSPRQRRRVQARAS